MNEHIAAPKLVFVVAMCLCILLSGCEENKAVSPSSPGDVQETTDMNGDDTAGGAGEIADGGAAEDADVPAGEDTGEDVGADRSESPPAQEPLEILATTAGRSCIGCQQVSFCGAPAGSDMRVVTMDAAPNAQTGLLFAAERWEAAGRALPPESCHVFTGDELDAVLFWPQGVAVLDGGAITWSGEMPLLEPPLSVDYSETTKNYSSVARWPPTQADWPDHYLAGADIHVDAAGGSDLSPFSAQGLSPEPFDIISPHTDEEGKIQNVPTDEALQVVWSGGGDLEDLVIILEGFYCPGTLEAITFLVMCHAANDGDFTIPAELLTGLEWPNYVKLHVTMSEKIALEVEGIDADTAWSIRTFSTVPIYHDPDAIPYPLQCESTSMEEGYVGDACQDDSECGGGCCLPEILDVYFYDNYCSITGCAGDDECPADAVCTENVHVFVPWDTYCARKCTSDSDCRFPELACLPTPGGAKACIPNFW